MSSQILSPRNNQMCTCLNCHRAHDDGRSFDPWFSLIVRYGFVFLGVRQSRNGAHLQQSDAITDELVPSIFEVGSATGISTPYLMGTVTLRITDNEGAKHSFTLKNVNYLPNSLVNISSLRHLAELYPDDARHPDCNGTGISSGYDSHTLHWDSARFSKTQAW